MEIKLFSTPIWIGNIDANKINFIEKEIKQSFLSGVKSSHTDFNKEINKESINYLYETIINIMNAENKLPDCSIQLTHIWSNHYETSDFQENHIHAGSDLSFIIYKKVDESKTIFVNPSSKMLEVYYWDCPKKAAFFGPNFFKPECRENQIVIFPSYLEHFVRRSNGAVTVAGNLRINFNKE